MSARRNHSARKGHSARRGFGARRSLGGEIGCHRAGRVLSGPDSLAGGPYPSLIGYGFQVVYTRCLAYSHDDAKRDLPARLDGGLSGSETHSGASRSSTSIRFDRGTEAGATCPAQSLSSGSRTVPSALVTSM